MDNDHRFQASVEFDYSTAPKGFPKGDFTVSEVNLEWGAEIEKTGDTLNLNLYVPAQTITFEVSTDDGTEEFSKEFDIGEISVIMDSASEINLTKIKPIWLEHHAGKWELYF